MAQPGQHNLPSWSAMPWDLVEPLLVFLGWTPASIPALKENLQKHIPEGFPVQTELPMGMLTLLLSIVDLSFECRADDRFFDIPSKTEGYRTGDIM